MMKVGVLGFLVLMFASSVSAQSTYCDDFGNCSGGGVNTYTDDFGNTSGTVGERSYDTYKDDFGNTSGSIGNESINTYSD